MGRIIEISDLSIRIKNRDLFNNINFYIDEGEAVLLSGENGMGKSTLLKSILRIEESGKQITGKIDVRGFGNVFDLNGDELQRLRSSVAYIQQKDEYSEMGNIQVRDILSDSSEAFSGKSLNYSEVNDLIDEWIPRKEDNRRVFDAKSKPAKFSGGEQRLLSVLSVIATRSQSDVLIIDEPLNNLDFANARNISNLINKVLRENTHMGLLMISHCRIFPFINREIKLNKNGIEDVSKFYSCHSCFGEPDKNGFY